MGFCAREVDRCAPTAPPVASAAVSRSLGPPSCQTVLQPTLGRRQPELEKLETPPEQLQSRQIEGELEQAGDGADQRTEMPERDELPTPPDPCPLGVIMLCQ